jgi:hypothetical protein
MPHNKELKLTKPSQNGASQLKLTPVFGGHALEQQESGGKRMVDLTDPTTPTWPELRLDGHVLRVCISLAVHFAILILFWYYLEGSVRSDAILVMFLFALALNSLVGGWMALKIQKTLHENGLYKHGNWLIRALLLSPPTLGLWIPASALLSAWRMRRKLEARWPKPLVE